MRAPIEIDAVGVALDAPESATVPLTRSTPAVRRSYQVSALVLACKPRQDQHRIGQVRRAFATEGHLREGAAATLRRVSGYVSRLYMSSPSTQPLGHPSGLNNTSQVVKGPPSPAFFARAALNETSRGTPAPFEWSRAYHRKRRGGRRPASGRGATCEGPAASRQGPASRGHGPRPPARPPPRDPPPVTSFLSSALFYYVTETVAPGGGGGAHLALPSITITV